MQVLGIVIIFVFLYIIAAVIYPVTGVFIFFVAGVFGSCLVEYLCRRGLINGT